VWVERVGVVHVHSRYSDGRSGIAELAAMARQADADFLVISDHDTLAARREGWEGRRAGVDVLVASEITPRRRGHLLACRVRECTAYAAMPQERMLDRIGAQGGFALVAHPQGKRKPWLRVHHEPWYEWRHPCVRGLEIWSYLHDWIEGVTWWRFPAAHTFYHHPERVVTGPESDILQLWDRLGRLRRYAGVGGLDCHARYVPLADVHLFPYLRMFRLLRNHFFVPRAGSPASAGLWEALEQGRGFVAHDALADSRGTTCRAVFRDGTEMMMGEERPFARGVRLEIRLPRKAEISWIADGRCRLRADSDRLEVSPCGPGVYRFEARVGGRPWLFTNPFYLRRGDAGRTSYR